jgi:hypothetical protein
VLDVGPAITARAHLKRAIGGMAGTESLVRTIASTVSVGPVLFPRALFIAADDSQDLDARERSFMRALLHHDYEKS